MTAKYSFSWAATVVQRFVEKYPRATEIFLEIWRISQRDLVKYLAIGDPVWPQIRETIHAIDNWSRCGLGLGWDYTYVKDLRRFLARKGYKRIVGRLDLWIGCITIREQSKGERPDPSVSEERASTLSGEA